MKSFPFLAAMLLAASPLLGASKLGSRWMAGDILFQTSRSAQSQAIQQATHSRWSHVGILLRKGGRWEVLEAVGPVKYTPVEDWIRRGEHAHVEAKRVKPTVHHLSDMDVAALQRVGERYLGAPYDRAFAWDDQKLYCSELVWKVYDRALGLKLGRLQRLRDFDLHSPEVRRKLKERYNGNIPLDEPVISPEAMFEAPELEPAWSR